MRKERDGHVDPAAGPPCCLRLLTRTARSFLMGRIWSKAPEARMREVRGNEISMIFQEPMSSLNPVYRIGDQMLEMIRTHHRADTQKRMRWISAWRC